MFRFLIACVKASGKQIEVVEDAIIEAKSFEEAAEIADRSYPLSQIMVVRIGRVVDVACADQLPLSSGA